MVGAVIAFDRYNLRALHDTRRRGETMHNRGAQGAAAVQGLWKGGSFAGDPLDRACERLCVRDAVWFMSAGVESSGPQDLELVESILPSVGSG
jgi:hypothetical protein